MLKEVLNNVLTEVEKGIEGEVNAFLPHDLR